MWQWECTACGDISTGSSAEEAETLFMKHAREQHGAKTVVSYNSSADEAKANVDPQVLEETVKPVTQAGWGWPGAAKKPHYFEAGDSMSLCGRWMYFGERTPPTPGVTTNDDCVTCAKKLAAKA